MHDEAPPATMREALALQGRRRGAHPAIRAPGRAPLSYAELARGIERAGETLAALGVGRGQRVATALPDGRDAGLAMLAAMTRSACAPLDWRLDAGACAALFAQLAIDALIDVERRVSRGQRPHVSADARPIPIGRSIDSDTPGNGRRFMRRGRGSSTGRIVPDNAKGGTMKPLHNVVALLACAGIGTLIGPLAPPAFAQAPNAKHLELIKEQAPHSGTEKVTVFFRDLVTRVERPFSAEITCRGQSGFKKVDELKDKLKSAIAESPTFADRVTVTAREITDGLGQMDIQVNAGQDVDFVNWSTTPCKTGTFIEQNDRFTVIPCVFGADGVLDLESRSGRGSRGQVDMTADDVTVAVATGPRPLQDIAQALAQAFNAHGRPAVADGATVRVANACSVTANTDDPVIFPTVGGQVTGPQ